MAIPAYMWIKDDQGNDVKSTVKIQGREGSAEILGFRHNVYIPSDADTGTLTGTGISHSIWSRMYGTGVKKGRDTPWEKRAMLAPKARSSPVQMHTGR